MAISGSSPTLRASNSVPTTLAFAQNQRDEVRLLGGDGVSPTLASGAGEGMNIQPVVMASTHTNAEIGRGGGITDSDGAQPEGCARTSNGDDVFPALCATDGDKQFIDNQSIRGGRLIIEKANSVQVQRGSGGEKHASL